MEQNLDRARKPIQILLQQEFQNSQEGEDLLGQKGLCPCELRMQLWPPVVVPIPPGLAPSGPSAQVGGRAPERFAVTPPNRHRRPWPGTSPRSSWPCRTETPLRQTMRLPAVTDVERSRSRPYCWPPAAKARTVPVLDRCSRRMSRLHPPAARRVALYIWPVFHGVCPDRTGQAGGLGTSPRRCPPPPRPTPAASSMLPPHAAASSPSRLASR